MPSPIARNTQRVYNSFTHALRTIIHEEGFFGLYQPGLIASLIREGSYSSIRMGLYPVVKGALAGDSTGDVGFIKKILAGLATGALGSAMANPTDLVKIRMQVDSGRIKDGIFVVDIPPSGFSSIPQQDPNTLTLARLVSTKERRPSTPTLSTHSMLSSREKGSVVCTVVWRSPCFELPCSPPDRWRLMTTQST